VVTAKRAAKKLVTKKKSTSATSSPKKLAAADPEPAQDPSTPHSPLYRGGSGGSPASGSPSRFASYASLIETRDGLAESLARSTPDAVATVNAMRQALKDASERLRETDARLTESLTAAAMVRVERDAAEARVDELAAINVALREAARKNEADVAAARVDVQTARNEARDAQAAMVRAKADARRLVDQHKSVADDKKDATRMEVERHRRDAEAAAAEAEASARRADEDAAVRIEDANRRAQETVAVFRRDADAARKEAQRAEESAAQAVADAARRGEEKASIYRRDAEAARAEAKRSKEELEAFRTRCAELERRAESHARLQKEAELARESAAETARRDVADAVAARDVAENRLANVEIALRAAEASRDAKASELAEFVSAREAFEKETRSNFETCARARDAAKETALAMERALSAEREASAVRVAEITASRESSRREVAEHKEKARAASALAASVEKKLVLIEADGPARERAAELREETSKARREADALRLKLDLTRDAQNVQTREEVASRAVLEKSLFEARDALGAARLETETTRAELERWQAAVRERDAAIDALGVKRLDLEAALESSRLDALEARRAAAAAEGRARAAVVADQKDRPHSGRHDRRDRGFVAVEGERLRSNGESVFGEKSLFGAAGGAYTVQHPASPAKRGERNFSRDASPFSPRRAGHRGVVSAPSPLRRVGEPNAPREAPDAPASVLPGGEDALISAFTRTAPREGW
jgi:hypothetical protein